MHTSSSQTGAWKCGLNQAAQTQSWIYASEQFYPEHRFHKSSDMFRPSRNLWANAKPTEPQRQLRSESSVVAFEQWCPQALLLVLRAATNKCNNTVSRVSSELWSLPRLYTLALQWTARDSIWITVPLVMVKFNSTSVNLVLKCLYAYDCVASPHYSQWRSSQ